KYSNTAKFSVKEGSSDCIGEVRVDVPDIRKERDPCGFLPIFKSFVKQETGRDTSFVRCISLPKSKTAHLIVNFPGMPYFIPSVSSASISRWFLGEFSRLGSSTL